MTIIDAIIKKMNAAENATADIGDKPRGGDAPQPLASLLAARSKLLATNDTYQVLDELLRFARGEITDVTTDW